MIQTTFDFSTPRRQLANIRYLLVCPIGWCTDEQGHYWTDRLWAKDLLLHFDYLTSITVLAPQQRFAADDWPADWVRIDPRPDGLRFEDFPSSDSLAQALLNLPRQFMAGMKNVLRSDVVHSGAAGWPIPPGLFINPLAALLKRPLVIVIESAFWRNHTRSASFKARLRHGFTEAFAKWSCQKARLAIFTHRGYQEELLPSPGNNALVSPASWIDADIILTPQLASESWRKKPVQLRFLVATRLIEVKGLGIVMRAIEKADATGQTIAIDVIGEGPMQAELKAVSTRLKHARMNVLEPIPYGPEFFKLLHGYHAVIVSSISDEQPRIVFDAYSQAIPVVASATPANAEWVTEGVSGLLYDKSSPDALLEALQTAHPESLRQMGMHALTLAIPQTHQAMHHARAVRLCQVLKREHPSPPNPAG